jgi:hypothetical protein
LILAFPSSTGAFSLVIGSWVVSAALFSILAMRVGASKGEANDGCLVGLCSVILSLLGGGAGLLLVGRHYPEMVYASVAGTLLLPALLVAFYRWRR